MFFSRLCGGACDAWGVVTNPINILPVNLFPRPEYHDTMHALISNAKSIQTVPLF